MRGEAGSVFPAPNTAWFLEGSIHLSASLPGHTHLDLLTGILGGRSCQLSPSIPRTQRATFEGMGREKGGEMMNSKWVILLPFVPSYL